MGPSPVLLARLPVPKYPRCPLSTSQDRAAARLQARVEFPKVHSQILNRPEERTGRVADVTCALVVTLRREDSRPCVSVHIVLLSKERAETESWEAGMKPRARAITCPAVIHTYPRSKA
jgi:hypothetical protein